MSEIGKAEERASKVSSEQALLGNLLLDSALVEEAVLRLCPEDFRDKRCRWIFEAVLALHDVGTSVEVPTVHAELERRGHGSEIAHSYLINLQGNSSPALQAYYIKDVGWRAKVPALMTGIGSLREAVLRHRPGHDSGAQLQEYASGILADLTSVSRRVEPVPVGVPLKTAIERIVAARDGVGPLSLSTGLTDLDRLLGGLQNDKLIVVAARPSVGKSLFGTQVAVHAASTTHPHLGRKARVLIFSLEMDNASIAARLLAERSDIPGDRLRSGDLSEQELEAVHDARAQLAPLGIHLVSQEGLSIAEVRHQARMHKQREGLDLVVVDYIQLVHGPQGKERYQEVGAVSQGLREMAMELHIPVLALAQLNREVNGRPQLRDIRESGNIEQDADVVVFLHRVEEESAATFADRYAGTSEVEKVELIIAKNRDGDRGTVQTIHDRGRFRLREIDQGPSVTEVRR